MPRADVCAAAECPRGPVRCVMSCAGSPHEGEGRRSRNADGSVPRDIFEIGSQPSSSVMTAAEMPLQGARRSMWVTPFGELVALVLLGTHTPASAGEDEFHDADQNRTVHNRTIERDCASPLYKTTSSTTKIWRQSYSSVRVCASTNRFMRECVFLT